MACWLLLALGEIGGDLVGEFVGGNYAAPGSLISVAEGHVVLVCVYC